MKYCVPWLLLIVVVLGSQVLSFYVTYRISTYNSTWLQELNKIEKSYGCTTESLWINVKLL